MDKPITFNEWLGTQGNMVLLHANCCRIAYEAGQQSMQAKVEELQEEFAEDERFLKDQIKDKDQKISNLEYQQGMDKELIQSLQRKSEKLQKRVDKAIRLLVEAELYQSDPNIDLAVKALKGEGK
ncbi:TPA: hypothetical protein ACSE4C_000319 [Acinetobacter baumannii]